MREPDRLQFELAPLLPDGAALFSAIHDVSFAESARRTRLALQIRITEARPEAAAAIAGIELGWGQSLDKLGAQLSASSSAVRPGASRSR